MADMMEMIQIIAYLFDATYEQMQVLRFLPFHFLLIMSMTYFD